MDDGAVQWYQHVVALLWRCAEGLTALSVPQEHQTLMEEGYKHDAEKMLLQVERLRKEKRSTENHAWIISAVGLLVNVASLFLPGVVGKAAGIVGNVITRML